MKVILRQGTREKLKQAFHVSESTISEALNYRNGSLLQRKIRSYAINKLNAIVI